MTPLNLLVDLGGTNARLALQDGPGAPLRQTVTWPCARFSGVEALLHQYLADAFAGPWPADRPVQCALGIASPVGRDLVQMTNLNWAFSARALKDAFGFSRLELLNDFTALALALPSLAPEELRPVGGGEAVDGQAWGLIGPGTGLGVGGLLPAPGGGYSAISGEGGHVTLAGHDDFEDAVLREVRRLHGHASAERVLSGPGLMTLLRAVEAVSGAGTAAEPGITQPEVVVKRALDGSSALCTTVVDLFLALLGSAAGNLALTLGAQRGVFIGGGIVPALGDAIHRSAFRARFEAKGRYVDYLRQIPTWVIDAREPPALRGAAQALAQPPRA